MIQPNTTLILIKNIPFDNTYEHTVSYANREAQHADLVQGTEGVDYFTVGTMTYQRYSKNSIRIQKPIEEIIECNYMCYKNTNYENKWIYAFITRMEYVNDITTEIEYEIDVMQTWFLFDTVKEISFIEREHTATDEIGGNIVPEEIEIGEYVYDGYQRLVPLSNNAVIIAITDTEEQNFNVYAYDNSFSGSKLRWYPVVGGESLIESLLSNYIQKPEAVTAIYICPISALPNGTDTPTVIPSGSYTKVDYIDNVSGITGNEDFGLYTHDKVKNKKLYTYPYNFLHVDNSNGNSLELRYEFFNGEPEFQMWGNFTYPPSINIAPQNYKGQGNTSNNKRTEMLSINNFPQCSWNNDTYRNWISRESTPLKIDTIKSVLQLAVGGAAFIGGAMATGGTSAMLMGIGSSETLGASKSAFNKITDIMKTAYRESIKADILRGSTTGNANIASNANTFNYARCRITEQMAEIVDNYFSMFGYAVKRVKRIQTRNRENWTYVKTNGANLHGKCGNAYNRKMVSILDNGITFWKDSISKVCNYNLPNNTL